MDELISRVLSYQRVGVEMGKAVRQAKQELEAALGEDGCKDRQTSLNLPESSSNLLEEPDEIMGV